MTEHLCRLKNAAEALTAWYRTSERPFPWRQSPTPYHVWLSEIMLQQTRIEAVIPYYERFIAELPDVASLAAVDDERLMKLWEGLGYYSRARNLKKAAIAVMEQFDGQLPQTAKELRRLAGIGPYTAGAVASIAFGQPEPAVDGNVLRVVSRLLADPSDIMLPATRERVTEQLRATYPEAGQGCRTLTQAWMELGERVCIPNGTPHCEDCPVRTLCLAHETGAEEEYPVRSAKKPRRIEPRTVLLLFCGDRFAVRRRPDTGLLAGLWEFPSLEGEIGEDGVRDYLATLGIKAGMMTPTSPAKHIFTHIEWHMNGYAVDCADSGDNDLTWVTAEEWLRDYAAPTAYRAFTKAVTEKFF
jgi:A/G-specific adenine glycosylase